MFYALICEATLTLASMQVINATNFQIDFLFVIDSSRDFHYNPTLLFLFDVQKENKKDIKQLCRFFP